MSRRRQLSRFIVRLALHLPAQRPAKKLEGALELGVGPLLTVVIPIVGSKALSSFPVLCSNLAIALHVELGAEPEFLLGHVLVGGALAQL